MEEEKEDVKGTVERPQAMRQVRRNNKESWPVLGLHSQIT